MKFFFRILDKVHFKAKFSQLPQFKPELIPTLGTPKELPTTPDVVLQSYRKKRKNATSTEKNTPKILSKFDASTVNLYRIHLNYLITKYTKLQVSMCLIVLHGAHLLKSVITHCRFRCCFSKIASLVIQD